MINVFTETKIANAKAVLMSYFDELPAAIQNGLIATKDKPRTLKIVDSVIYSQKFLGANTTKELMESSDTVKAGITNINNRKLEPLNYMVVTGIRLLSDTITAATPGSPTEAEIAGATLDIASDKVINGELEILVAGKTAYPRTSCRVFANTDDHQGKGYYQLESPFVIAPQAEIVPTLRIYSAVSGDEVIRVELLGARIINA